MKSTEISSFAEHLGVVVVFQHGKIFHSVLKMLVVMEMLMASAAAQ